MTDPKPLAVALAVVALAIAYALGVLLGYLLLVFRWLRRLAYPP